MQRVHLVGGGVIGLSLAYELSRHGIDVCVLERNTAPGREASWAGAGILPPANLDTAVHAWEQLRGLSHRLHAEWAEALRAETGIDTGYRTCGGIYLARTAGEAALLQALVAAYRHEGIRIERIDSVELRRIEPGLVAVAESGGRAAAYWLPEEAQLRNPWHMQALRAACERRGVRIECGVEVQHWDVSGGQVAGLQTNRGPVATEAVCVTGGAWAHRLLHRMGVPTGILPIRGQMLLYRCAVPPLQRIINEGPRYVVPREDGHVLVGSSEEEAGYEKHTTEPVLAELRGLAESLVPDLRSAELADSWAGLRPGSFDGQPYLGRIPGVQNGYVAAGHFRSGLHTSPATAIVMSQLMRGERPQIDLQPFRIGRG